MTLQQRPSWSFPPNPAARAIAQYPLPACACVRRHGQRLICSWRPPRCPRLARRRLRQRRLRPAAAQAPWVRAHRSDPSRHWAAVGAASAARPRGDSFASITRAVFPTAVLKAAGSAGHSAASATSHAASSERRRGSQLTRGICNRQRLGRRERRPHATTSTTQSQLAPGSSSAATSSREPRVHASTHFPPSPWPTPALFPPAPLSEPPRACSQTRAQNRPRRRPGCRQRCVPDATLRPAAHARRERPPVPAVEQARLTPQAPPTHRPGAAHSRRLPWTAAAAPPRAAATPPGAASAAGIPPRCARPRQADSPADLESLARERQCCIALPGKYPAD